MNEVPILRFQRLVPPMIALLLLASTARVAGSATDVWSPMGLQGARILSLAIDPATPSTLYAAATFPGIGGLVLKSIDSGRSWRKINNGLPADQPVTMVIDPKTPSTLYLALSDPSSSSGAVFKTIDGGESWLPASSGLAKVDIRAMVIDLLTPDILYVAQQSRGVSKTTNGAVSWTPINSGLSTLESRSLAIDPHTPNTLFVGLLHFSSMGNCAAPQTDSLFRSTNGGGTWSNASAGLINSPQAIAIDPRTPTTLYAATSQLFCVAFIYTGIFKSTDGGESWKSADNGLPAGLVVNSLAIDPQTSSTVYAGGRGVYRSIDGGGSWTSLSDGLVGFEASIVNTLVIDPKRSTTLYAGTSDGLFVLNPATPPPSVPQPASPPPQQIPTLSTWMTLVLAMLFLLIAARAQRRKAI